MKILMTIENYLPGMVGGAEVHVFNLKKHLEEQGHEIHLITRGMSFPDPEREKNVHRVGYPGSLLAKFHEFVSFIKALLHLSTKVDLFHSHYSYRYAFWTGIVARILRKPFIITLHGFGTLDKSGPTIFTLRYRLYRYVSVKLATRVISTSEDLLVNFEKYSSLDKVDLIYNGVDSTLMTTATSEAEVIRKRYSGKKILLAVRRMNDKNGIHFLVDALAKYRNEFLNLNCVLILIGWGKHEQYIRSRIREFSLDEEIIILGKMPNDQISGYLQAANIALFPSSAESTSIACIEAMVTGNLCLVSKVGGLIELIGDNEERGIFMNIFPWTHSDYEPPMTLPEASYKEIYDKIYFAVSQYKELEPKISRGKSYALANFDWRVIAKKTERTYEASYSH